MKAYCRKSWSANNIPSGFVSVGRVKPWKKSTPWVERKVCWGFRLPDSLWWAWGTKTVETVGKALSVFFLSLVSFKRTGSREKNV